MLPRIFRSEPEIRQRQINTLKIFNDNVIEITEGSEYCIAFVSGKHELTLQIFLTIDFPNEKPKLKISPCVVHSWVNTEGDVTLAPGLLNFTVHSDLGRVVQAIIREFERNPPPLAEPNITKTSSPVNFSTDIDMMGVSNTNYPISSYSQLKTFATSNNSVMKSTFPELNNLSVEELQLLNDNIDKQNEFLENLSQVQEMNKTLDDLIVQIEELAETNLSKRNLLEELQEERNMRVETVTKLLNNNEILNQSYQLLSDKYTPGNIKELLRMSAAKADEQSEGIAETFLDGSMDVEQFVSSYIKSRTLSHVRKTKEEKLAHQLSELERAGF